MDFLTGLGPEILQQRRRSAKSSNDPICVDVTSAATRGDYEVCPFFSTNVWRRLHAAVRSAAHREAIVRYFRAAVCTLAAANQLHRRP